MEDRLWNLFLDTGDPLGYLLYRAQRKEAVEQEEQTAAAEEPPQE